MFKTGKKCIEYPNTFKQSNFVTTCAHLFCPDLTENSFIFKTFLDSFKISLDTTYTQFNNKIFNKK